MQIKKKFSPVSKVESPYYIKPTVKTPIDKDVINDTLSLLIAY